MFVYILHFDEPLSHAQHYVGMTGNLKQRLEAHAAGNGARLTEVLNDEQRGWILAGLFQTTAANARRVEKNLKESKNLQRYCDICNPDAPAPAGSKRYPLADVNFPQRSSEMASANATENRITIREGRDQLDINLTRTIQTKHKVELGFLNDTALWTACNEQHMYVVEFNGVPCGFAIWTYHAKVREVTIHQCAVLDEARLRGCARAMIAGLAAMNPTSSLWCKVRVDLPANYFWEAIGFSKVRTLTHKTSKQPLNQYFKAALQCEIKSYPTTNCDNSSLTTLSTPQSKSASDTPN